jgi:prepilin-type processing-associated H-X9-DG protein
VQRLGVTDDVPHPGSGVPWDWWGRFGSGVNVAFADLPLCGRRARLSDEDISGLPLAATEVLTNGIRHGRGPRWAGSS